MGVWVTVRAQEMERERRVATSVSKSARNGEGEEGGGQRENQGGRNAVGR